MERKVYEGLIELVSSKHELVGDLPMHGRFIIPKEGEFLLFSNRKNWICTSIIKDLRLDLDAGELWIYTLNSVYKITEIKEVING